jgi:hypothetical protein
MAETGMAHLGHRDDEGRNRRYWPIPHKASSIESRAQI